MAAAALLAGCQSDDVGTPCDLSLLGASCVAGTNYYESSASSSCENLTCIHSSGMDCPTSSTAPVAGVCSKRCVSDSDCDNGTTCKTIVLDAAYINSLPQAVRDRYLGDIQSSDFCAGK